MSHLDEITAKTRGTSSNLLVQYIQYMQQQEEYILCMLFQHCQQLELHNKSHEDDDDEAEVVVCIHTTTTLLPSMHVDFDVTRIDMEGGAWVLGPSTIQLFYHKLTHKYSQYIQPNAHSLQLPPWIISSIFPKQKSGCQIILKCTYSSTLEVLENGRPQYLALILWITFGEKKFR